MNFFLILIPVLFFYSCVDFLNPEQELDIVEDQLFDDWYEYRSIEMGLYGLQQQLVEQLVVLGELRADLLTITENADADLIEIHNLNISENNRYASPTVFFKLIAACNNFIRVLETEHPEVLDPESPVTNFDRLYGEALCMRAWTYFNAVRIYGKVPYIHESLTTLEEIEEYVNSPGTYVDSVHIVFGRDGYANDTTYNYSIELEKMLYDLDMVIDVFTNQLENSIKAVGVIHYIDNNDYTWEVTIWNTWAMHALLGLMYLTEGDYSKAESHFYIIMHNTSDNNRYQLTGDFGYGNWREIFRNIDLREHIYTIWFDKANQQQNDFQSLFELWGPHNYMLKPTRIAIDNWETIWRNQVIRDIPQNPTESEMIYPGFPSDYYRGLGGSYLYVRNEVPITGDEYLKMLSLRVDEDFRSSANIMEGMDTVVIKYSIGKNTFDEDANFIVYRAGGIHLYMAELYTWWSYDRGGFISPFTSNAVNIVNDGSNYSARGDRPQRGVRGRVGLGSGYDGIRIANTIYEHDPYTNEIIGFTDLTGNLVAKQLFLEEEILEERARELAFEGERFYDLMRVAKRRQDPSFLAEKVSAKFPAGQRQQVYNYLLNENNWYINIFDW
ncbi:MAG: RagB/SusD family nutrient uptake outer membrane protein [Bacteroidales bacterium]|nr:RagB/SusD family nutrient uptake outer membrane protein [Bacteroidales bacterium]